MLLASYSHRQCAEHHLPGKVRDVDSAADDDIAFAERVCLSPRTRVEALVNVNAHIERDRIETDIALRDCVGDDRTPGLQPSLGVA